MDVLAQSPKLDSDHRLYWDAFWELSSCRLSAMSIGQIPMTAMFEWCYFYEYTREESHFFVQVLRLLDAGYMKTVTERQKSAAK